MSSGSGSGSDSGEYAIVGAGQTAVGHLPEYSKRDLAAEAARLAIEDAGVDPGEIEASIRAERKPGPGPLSDYVDEFPRILRLPVKVHFEVGRGGEMAALAVTAAAELIDRGVSEYVLVSCGCDDWSRTHAHEYDGREQRHIPVHKDGLWGAPLGEVSALHFHPFLAVRHMHEFGTTSEDLGRIAVAQREWATLNPDAYMHDRPMTLDDYLESEKVVEPYRVLDCALQSDGGAAFLLTGGDNVDETEPEPVYVEGVGFGEQIREDWWTNENYTRLPVGTAKETAFGAAGITIDDVDVAQLYDCFTAEVLFQIEDYGWAPKGEGAEPVREGRLGPDGDLPINTGGGLLSSHHFGNMTGLIEAVRQLRGEAGDRQVDGAETALVSGHGGEIVNPGMASIHSTLVLGR